MSTVTKENAVDIIAAYAARRRYEDLSETAITRARQVILDTLGTALGGYQTRLGQLAAGYAAYRMPGEESTLVADGRSSSAEGAAWANGTMCKFLGMDDTSRLSGHVASELAPVVLALGEHLHLNGHELITALAVGYDVFDTLQPPVRDWQRERGLDHKSQVGSMASAVTAAVAMGLSEELIGQALALAMDMASGTEQYVWDAGYCDTKDLLAGLGARNGIMAARMAEYGFQGPPGALDGEYGYFHAFGPGYDPAYLEVLGKRGGLAETGFKPHAGCRHVHSCVDATQALRNSNGGLELDAITSIEIGSYHEAINPFFRIDPEPETTGLAGFSLPVTVAVVLQRGGWYRSDIETWDEPMTRHLRRLVKVELDEELENSGGNGCKLKINTRDGGQYCSQVDYALGEPEKMLSDAEFEGKFRYLIGDLLPEEQIVGLLDSCARLEELDDVGGLLSLASARVKA